MIKPYFPGRIGSFNPHFLSSCQRDERIVEPLGAEARKLREKLFPVNLQARDPDPATQRWRCWRSPGGTWKWFPIQAMSPEHGTSLFVVRNHDEYYVTMVNLNTSNISSSNVSCSHWGWHRTLSLAGISVFGVAAERPQDGFSAVFLGLHGANVSVLSWFATLEIVMLTLSFRLNMNQFFLIPPFRKAWPHCRTTGIRAWPRARAICRP